MFLPLAVADEEGFGDLDAGMLARRLPDFVHQILNRGTVGPTGVLEVQSPPEEGPVTWVVMDAPPDLEEAFELMPEDAEIRAVVCGELRAEAHGFHVEFHVYHNGCGDGHRMTTKVGLTIDRTAPVFGLTRLIRQLAPMLGLEYQQPPAGLLTDNADAFFHFLRGLDNAMLLSGDLMIRADIDSEMLMRPFAEALRLDPGFGLALRIASTTMVVAMAGARLDSDAARRFLDVCYSTLPIDGDACVAVADQLHEMGDEQRALAWLEHAAHLEPPPSRGLENLGILFANRGETIAARDLWLKGIDVDGHPDFFGHLARLHFAEDRALDAWDMLIRGLRRLGERLSRRSEWDDDGRGAGVLLQYMHEDLRDRSVPEDVVYLLQQLVGLLNGEDQVHLGLCLMMVGHTEEALRQLQSAGELEELENGVRDMRNRALLELEVGDFGRRFDRACQQAMRGRAKHAVAELLGFLDVQPDYWPAMFYAAIGLRRLKRGDEALDLLDEALRLAPADDRILREMAEEFASRGNQKRALELFEQALMLRPTEAALWADKVRCLVRLGRFEEARIAVMAGLELDGGDRSLLAFQRQLGGDQQA